METNTDMRWTCPERLLSTSPFISQHIINILLLFPHCILGVSSGANTSTSAKRSEKQKWKEFQKLLNWIKLLWKLHKVSFVRTTFICNTDSNSDTLVYSPAFHPHKGPRCCLKKRKKIKPCQNGNEKPLLILSNSPSSYWAAQTYP